MNKQEQLRIVSISYLISIGITFILSYLKSSSLNINDILSAFRVSTILTVWWCFYFNIGWKIKYVNKILYRINLNGTWYGTYKSVNTNTGDVYEGEIIIRIKQSFLTLSINSYTEKYTNYSHSEVLKYDEKSDIHGLVYVYSQKENNPLDLDARNGTAELVVLDDNEKYKLNGEFWTILGSKGLLNVTRISDKCTNSFISGKKLYNEYNRNMEEVI
jgi:hypothetical protein